MGLVPAKQEERGRWARHQRAVQRSRVWEYLVYIPIGIAAKLLGILVVSWPWIALPTLLGLLSVVGFRQVVARAERQGASRLADLLLDPRLPAWVLVDLTLMSLVIGHSGGLASPWFLAYPATTIGAGFVGGLRGAITASVLTLLFYVGAIAYAGQTGFLAIATAVVRLLVLNAATVFAVLGTIDRTRKRQTIERLREEESRKVSELTRLTEALNQRQKELSAAAVELADANLRILEADRQKSQFLAAMSHELRTPLNSIIGFSEILLSKMQGTVDPKYSRFLQNIHGSGTHLLGLINDILDLSKIESGKMEVHPEKLRLVPLVEGVIAVMRGQASRREIKIVCELPEDLPDVEADESRVKQVLFNLISNAVKFSPDGAEVRVTGRPLGEADSPLGTPSVEIDVIDHGIGIDPRDHRKVFQEFHQLDAALSRRAEGTGLGLALVKKFVELHAGDVGVDSQLGQGSTFRLVLPIQFAGPRVPSSMSSIPPPVHEVDDGRPLVLVVEDDDEAYGRMEPPLAAYRLARARTGEEALIMLRSLRPAAMTLDLVLPGIDGWEVLRRLKLDPEVRHVPVVIVSALDSNELGTALGAEGFFIKPTDGSGLASALARLVSRPVGAEARHG